MQAEFPALRFLLFVKIFDAKGFERLLRAIAPKQLFTNSNIYERDPLHRLLRSGLRSRLCS